MRTFAKRESDAKRESHATDRECRCPRINLYVAANRVLRESGSEPDLVTARIDSAATLDSRAAAGWTRATRRVIFGCQGRSASRSPKWVG